MKEIDELFKSGETQKELMLNDALWNRIEDKLDKKDSNEKKVKRSLSIAASIVLIVAAGLSIVLKSNSSYQVEDLDQLDNPLLNAQVINVLHDSYPVVTWDLNG